MGHGWRGTVASVAAVTTAARRRQRWLVLPLLLLLLMLLLLVIIIGNAVRGALVAALGLLLTGHGKGLLEVRGPLPREGRAEAALAHGLYQVVHR